MTHQLRADWLSIGPELHMVFAVPSDFTLTGERWNVCCQTISKAAARVFEKRFDVQMIVPVSNDKTALEIRVRPGLDSLPRLLAVYVHDRTDNRYFADDIRWCWEQLARVTRKIMAGENAAITVDRIEQVRGAIERLDGLSGSCRKKGVWEDADLAEAKSNLTLVYCSRVRNELVPAMNAYFNAVYPSNREKSDADRDRFDFLSGLLLEEARRRDKGIFKKPGVRSVI